MSVFTMPCQMFGGTGEDCGKFSATAAVRLPHGTVCGSSARNPATSRSCIRGGRGSEHSPQGSCRLCLCLAQRLAGGSDDRSSPAGEDTHPETSAECRGCWLDAHPSVPSPPERGRRWPTGRMRGTRSQLPQRSAPASQPACGPCSIRGS